MRVFFEGFIRLILGVAAIYVPMAAIQITPKSTLDSINNYVVLLGALSFCVLVLGLTFEPMFRHQIKQGKYGYESKTRSKTKFLFKIGATILNFSALIFFFPNYIQFLSVPYIAILLTVFILAHIIFILDAYHWLKNAY